MKGTGCILTGINKLLISIDKKRNNGKSESCEVEKRKSIIDIEVYLAPS